MTNLKPLQCCLALLLLSATGAPSYADDAVARVHFENQRFAPQVLNVAAGQPLTIQVENASDETIEFESFKLHREKVVAPGATIIVRLPALSAGTYDFYDDFHQDVPEGAIVAK